MQALKLDEVGKWQTINNFIGSSKCFYFLKETNISPVLRRTLKRIGIIKDSVIAQSLKSGSNTAMAYLLHKIPQSNLQWE